MDRLSMDALDFVYVLGDTYIDHPSFGAAIIARVLQSKGFSVGLICQPDWHSVDDFRRLGRPKLGFLVSSGEQVRLVPAQYCQSVDRLIELIPQAMAELRRATKKDDKPAGISIPVTGD